MDECTCHRGTEATGLCQGCGLPFCDACLLRTPDGVVCCRSCAQTGACRPKPRDPGGLAIASLVLSLAGFMFCGVTAIPGMVMGFVELGRIKRGESPESGRGMALAGAIVGTILTAAILLSILVIIIAAIIAAATAA